MKRNMDTKNQPKTPKPNIPPTPRPLTTETFLRFSIRKGIDRAIKERGPVEYRYILGTKPDIKPGTK